MAEVSAIVLAAGQGARYRAAGGEGPSKLVAALDGKPLVRRVVEAALASRARPIVVVTGHARDAVLAALGDLGSDDVQVVHNRDHADGLSTSLRAGIAALPKRAAGAVVLLADMPQVTAGAIDALIAALEAHPDALAAVPVFRGERGNPVAIARPLFGALMRLTGDRGARKALETAGAAVIEVPVDEPGVLADIDTPEALRQASTTR